MFFIIFNLYLIYIHTEQYVIEKLDVRNSSGGGQMAVSGISNSSRGGFKATRADNALEYIGKVSKEYGTDTKQNAKNDKAITGALYDISRELTSMNESQRKEYLKSMGIYKNAFNSEDGSIKSDLRADINEGAVSSNLRAISATLEHMPIGSDVELSESAGKAKSYVEKMLGERASVVVTSDKTQNNAFYNQDEGIIYINNNSAFSGEEIAEFVATHEITHITEGTRAYAEMALLLDEIVKDPNAPAALKAKIGDTDIRKKLIRSAYAEQMKNMNFNQREYLVETEYTADLVGLLLGDEYFIEKLAQRDASLVQKIFNRLKELAKRGRDVEGAGKRVVEDVGKRVVGDVDPYNKKSASVDRESAKYLSKLVSKFGKAIDNAKGGVKISQLGGTDEEKNTDENVDFIDEKRYNKGRSRTKDYYSYGRVGQTNISTIRKALTRLFFGTNDVIANSFAIESGNSVYIVDSAKTNGKIEFGVFEKIEIDDDLLRKEYIRRKNDDAISKGYISDELFTKLGRGNDSGWRSDRQQELGKELSVDTRESQDNQGRVSEKNGNSGEKLKTDKIDDTRYSISKSVDSDGNSLSADQAEYFKNSKVRDEKGNLLVVYHGSEAIFNEFKHRYINTHGSQEGRGFYFTDSVNMARGYERDGGQLLKGYVNISKPLSDTELTLTRKEVASLIKAIDPTGDDLIANYDTGGGMGYPSQAWYNRAFNDTLDSVMNYCDTDSEVLAELRNAGADEEKLLKTVRRTLGYDGYITSEKYENAQIFVAFESNQFKNADNTAPTDNPDIRYSKSKSNIDFEEVDGGVKVTISNPITENADRKRAAEQEQKESFRNLVENDPEEIKHRAAERERKESEESLLNDGKAREVTTEFDEDNSTNAERRLMALAERAEREKEFLPRHTETVPSSGESWDYWLNEVDRREGSVRKLKNGKIKVGMAQTANEMRLVKYINKNIMEKAYSNENVKAIIDKVLTSSDIWGSDKDGTYMAKLKGADLATVEKRLWAALNTAPEGERIGPALNIADYIVNHGMLEETVEVTEDVVNAQYIIETLEPYKRKIDISHIRDEIETWFGQNKDPISIWTTKGSSTSVTVVAQELESAGIMLNGDRGKLVNEADIFIAIHELYTDAQAVIKAATPTKNDIIGAYDAKEVHDIKQKIAKEILRSYDEYGKETPFARLKKKHKDQITSLKKRVNEVYELNRAKNEMLYLAGKFQDKKKGKFHNATQAQNEALNGIISVLSRLKYRSDINKSSSRALLDELSKWYVESNPLLQGMAVDKNTSESKGFYSAHIKELIDYFRLDEAVVNDSIVSNFISFSEKEIANYDNSEKISIAENDDQIRAFIDASLGGENNGKKLIIGKITDALAEKIKKSTGVDLQGFNFELRADALLHMKKKHGNAEKEAQRGQSAVDTNAVLNAIEVVTSFDTVEKGKNDNSLVFIKNINGVYHVVTYYAYGNKSIYPHTLYITKKDGLAQTNNANENTSYLARNVQDDLSTATNNSITESGEKVNKNAKNNAELSLDELHAINKILAHMNFVVENFGKIWRRGKWVEAGDVAKKQYEIFKRALETKYIICKAQG